MAGAFGAASTFVPLDQTALPPPLGRADTRPAGVRANRYPLRGDSASVPLMPPDPTLPRIAPSDVPSANTAPLLPLVPKKTVLPPGLTRGAVSRDPTSMGFPRLLDQSTPPDELKAMTLPLRAPAPSTDT